MTTSDEEPTRRGVAGPLVGGAVALGALFLGGAFITAPRMQHRLEAAANPPALAGLGGSPRVTMSGQRATVHCQGPVDQATVKSIVLSVRGVQSVEFDPGSCDYSGEQTTLPPATTAPATNSTSPAATIAATTTATTTTATTSTTTTVATAAPVVSVRLAFGQLTLLGKVGSTKQRDLVAFVVGHAVADGNMTVELVVDPTVKIDDAVLGRLGAVALAMPVNLVAGSAGIEGEKVHVVGEFADDAHRAAFEQAVQRAAAVSELVLRPVGTAADAAKVNRNMNALVASTPIQYKKGATDVAPESQATIERLAGMAKRFAGLHIEVQGHTDSQGDPARNLLLSQRRAQAALDAMVALGVPESDLSAKGFGETQLIRDQNGKEIAAKSRRVVFGVSVQ